MVRVPNKTTEFHPPAWVSRVFEQFCADQELIILSEAVAKHGSWEWAALKQGDINRAVTLALTEVENVQPGEPTFVIESWAEADTTTRFCRRMVSQFPATRDSLTKHSEQHGVQDETRSILRNAWHVASKLTETDLTETYLVSRT